MLESKQFQIQSLQEIQNYRKQKGEYLSMGCIQFDNFLNGGFVKGILTEVCGEAGTGKTQLCMQLMLQSIKQQQNIRPSGKAIYISTSKQLNEVRFTQLKNAIFGQIDLKNHLIIRHALNISEFNQVFEQEIKGRINNQEDIKIIIIDSIYGIAQEYMNPSNNSQKEYQERNTFVNKVAQILKQIAFENHIVVLTTNFLLTKVEDGESQPGLGYKWSENVNERFELLKYQIKTLDLQVKGGPQRQMKVIFSPRLEQNSMQFQIAQNGLEGIINQ